MLGAEIVRNDIAGSIGHAGELPADVVVGKFRRDVVEVEADAFVQHVVDHYILVIHEH